MTNQPVDINSQDGLCRTPIHLAVCNRHINAVQLLIEYGANPCIVDGYGQGALDWASMDQALFQEMGKWSSTYVRTPDEIRAKSLQRSVILWSKRLLETKQKRLSPGSSYKAVPEPSFAVDHPHTLSSPAAFGMDS